MRGAEGLAVAPTAPVTSGGARRLAERPEPAAGSAGLAARPSPGAGPALRIIRRPVSGGRPAVLLHGLASTATAWQRLLAEPAAADLDAVLADLPWRSEHVFDWSRQLGEHNPVPEVLEAAGGRSRGGVGTVIAHSFSGNLLLEFLSRELERGADPFRRYGIRRLVFVSTFYRRSAEDFEWGLGGNLERDFVRIMAEGLHTHGGGRLDPEVCESMARKVCERVGPYGWLRFSQVYLRTPWLRPELFSLPCLVVCGGHDGALPESEALAADLPAARFHVIPECGHYPMAERPSTLAAVIGRFLKRSS